MFVAHNARFDFTFLNVALERLDYDALSASRSLSLHRFTAGGRVRLWSCLNGLVNVVHQPAGLAAGRSNALDAGVTCTVRR